MSCLFIEIPVELRLQIYSYLLPDRCIPVIFRGSSLRSDRAKVQTAIMRVSRQIYVEASTILYGSVSFSLGVTPYSMTMCDVTEYFTKAMEELNLLHLRYNRGAVGEYERQLMALDQHNQRRLLMERQQQDRVAPQRQNFPDPNFRPNLNPAISKASFCKIRSFRVEIALTPRRRLRSSRVAKHNHYDFLERVAYTTCDSLHKIIARLETVRPHIRNLEISIWVEDMYMKRDEALAAVQVLLRPFRRLRNVSKPRVCSVVSSYRHSEAAAAPLNTVLFPDPMNQETEADLRLENYLRCWEKEISSCEPAPELSAISTTYWQLEKLVHSFLKISSSFDSLLHAAKVAREAEDLPRLKETMEEVMNIWYDYPSQQDRSLQNTERQ
jgi:hypothetical protein